VELVLEGGVCAVVVGMDGDDVEDEARDAARSQGFGGEPIVCVRL
jgi:hypothetical protein